MADIYPDIKTWLQEKSTGTHASEYVLSPERRAASLKAVAESNFPTRKDEEWRYTPITHVVNRSIQSGTDLSIDADQIQEIKQIVPEACHVVFVDGQYSAQFSDDITALAKQGVAISSLGEMNDSQSQLAEAMLTNAKFSDANIFQHMTLGLVNSGLFIRVEQNTEIEMPLHIIYVNGPTESAIVQTPVNFIRLGTNSRLTCIQHFVNSDESKAITIPADFFDLAEGSGIQSYRIGVESDRTDHISNSYARIAGSARFVSHQYLLGSRLTRSNTEVLFDGEGAEAVLRGIYLGDNDQHLDIRTYVDHAKPNCMSDQHFRGILGGKARGVFNGLVMVQKDAQHTNAEQSNKNLLLSREARVDTKPQLEIYADDVKCGHGATVGELDEDALFYLQSRGISKEDAAQMLIHAFAAEVTQDIAIGSLQPYILDKLDKKLSEITEA